MPFHDLGKKLDRRFDVIEDKIEYMQDRIKEFEDVDGKEPYTEEEVIDAINELWQ